MSVQPSISFQPLNMMSPPNFYAEAPEFVLTQGQAVTLWIRVGLTDALGTRRRTPAAGATYKLRFPRARQAVVGSATVGQDQTFDVSGVLLSDDRSMASFVLTAEQVSKIFPGNVLLILQEGSNTITVTKNLVLKKVYPAGTC